MTHRITERLIPLRTLIVEDCEDDFDLLVLRLRFSGFAPDVRRVATAAEINQAMAAGEWQLVMSDFDLPGIDGLRVLELVRAADRDVPFFIISGVIDEEQAVAALQAGAQDYLFKGKLGRLGSAVMRELEEARKRRERKDQQVALERDRVILTQDRIRFVDVMSHELRTPLNIINLAANMLARYGERMNAAARLESTSEIQDAVARMTRIIDKVLLTSRIELQRWELRSNTFDLAAWFAEFLANNTSESDRRQRLHIELADLPAHVAMDERIVEIALQNVLSNALKYSPSDSRVVVTVAGGTAGQIDFTVRDQGIGIPESELSQVTGSFYRASNVGPIQGTGLGLAIVKGCTDLHGGTLEIESKQDQGTCVRMGFPDWLRVRPVDTALIAQQEVAQV